jgi:hypothetical protein
MNPTRFSIAVRFTVDRLFQVGTVTSNSCPSRPLANARGSVTLSNQGSCYRFGNPLSHDCHCHGS